MNEELETLLKNFIGRRIGKNTITKIPNQKIYCEVTCACGSKSIKDITDVLSGLNAMICYCKKKKGLIKRREHSLYSTWVNMKRRCYETKNRGYKYYGGRGIKICKRWLDFENFVKDMGEKPSKEYRIERIDNNGDYTPENCKWATMKEQSNNKRPYQGKVQKLILQSHV